MSPLRKLIFTSKDTGAGGGLGRVAGFLLASALLLAAGLWLGKRETGAPVMPPTELVAKGEWTPVEFGGFEDGMLIDRTTAFPWDEVPPFRIDAAWRGLEATNAESDDLGQIEADGAAGVPGFSREENWREPAGFFFRPDIDPRVIRYKIDPSFGFENRERLLKGMMIRVQVSF
jgi:hypothetical protein